MKNKIISLIIVGVVLGGSFGIPSVQAQALDSQSALLASISQLTNSFTQLLASVAGILTKQAGENGHQAVIAKNAKEIAQTIQTQLDAFKNIVDENKGMGAGSAISQSAQEIGQVARQLSRTLRPGSTGQDVITLQEHLSSQDNIYPEKLVTGYYGPLTKEAVTKFQEKAGLEPVGLVGPKTLTLINQELAAEESVTTDNITIPPALSLSEYTIALLNIANELKQAPVVKKQAIAVRLAEFARMRKNVVLQEIRSNPQVVIDNALPSTVVSQLSPDIQALLEVEVTIRGKFQAFHIDNSDGSSKYEFWLTDETTGRRYQLHFANDKYTNALTDDRVQARGVRIDGEIALAAGSTSVQTLAASSPTIAPNTFGPQKTLLMLVNFSDKTTQPYTIPTAQSVMITTNNFDLENSFVQTSLVSVVDAGQSADVRGWYTIPLSSTVCNNSTLASQAKQAATAAGVDLSSYTRYVYAFPNNACTWWGLGTVGGNPSQAWVNGTFSLRVVGHEMGHNFGLYHSHSLACASGTCTTSEYGDGYDIMGGSSNHFNAFQKSRLGWLNYNISPPITLISSNGTYAITPYESNDTQPKALQILKSSGTTNTYYVEYRAGLGFDTGKTAVIVHSGVPSTANSSNLWDLDQVTTISDWILDVGQTYQDAAAGISITAVSQDAIGATINIAFDPSACVSSNPSFVFSPTSVSLFAGQSASFNYTLTNNDTPSCPSSNFSITPVLPAGFTQSPAPITHSLVPGTSISETLIISTPTDAGVGSYSITETAQNTSTSTVYISTASLTMTILPPTDTTPPIVTITSPVNGATVSKGNVQIAVSASDASGIAEIKIVLDGSVIKTCFNTTSCSATVRASKLTVGTHSITAQATDKAGPVANTASASITIIKR